MSRRNEVLIAQDRATICNLLRKGYRSRTEIASIINENRDKDAHVTPEQVGYDIEFMRKKYLEQGLEDFNAYRNQILDELAFLQRTYWEGYELSRRSKITLESEAVVDEENYGILSEEGLGLQPNENVFNRQVRTREEQRLEGNVAYLQGVERVIDRKAKIYGVDAPNKIALTDPSGNNEATNVFELMIQKMDDLEKRRKELQETSNNEGDNPKLLHE